MVTGAIWFVLKNFKIFISGYKPLGDLVMYSTFALHTQCTGKQKISINWWKPSLNTKLEIFCLCWISALIILQMYGYDVYINCFINDKMSKLLNVRLEDCVYSALYYITLTLKCFTSKKSMMSTKREISTGILQGSVLGLHHSHCPYWYQRFWKLLFNCQW